MGLSSTAITGGAALAGGMVGAGLLAATGAGAAVAGLGGLMMACSGACLAQLQTLRSDRQALQKAFDELQADMADVVERQARSDAKFAEMERRTIESPALVWRAAAADIEVLGSLVSDLARSVADHEERLSQPVVSASPSAAPAMTLPESIEAELHFTPDAPAAPMSAASPFVIAELRSTLATALTSERLELCLQPIVELPQRKARGYEATLRLRGDGGDHQGDAELRRIAAATGLEHELDRVLVERGVQVLRVLRARNRAVSMHCAIAGESLLDPAFQKVIETLIRNDTALAKALVLDISDADFRTLDADHRALLRGWCGRGLGAGLNRLPHMKPDLATMAAIGMGHLRIPAAIILAAADDQGIGDIHPADFAEYLQRRGINLLVSDVGSEQTVLDLLDFGAPSAMGPLFGPSRPVRPEVLEPKAVEATPPAEKPAPMPAPTTQEQRRQSYRSMLRRA